MVGERGQRTSGGLIPQIDPPWAHVGRRMSLRRVGRAQWPASAAGVVTLTHRAARTAPNERMFCYFSACLFRYSALTESFNPFFDTVSHRLSIDCGYPECRTTFAEES
jgi:hypothetical protein